MKKHLGLAVALVCVAGAARADDAVTFRPLTVELPQSGQAFPPGDGAELVTNDCTGCHSPGMILTQPKLSPATWTAEVQKMQRTYKAPVDDADVPALVAYLATLPRPGGDR